MRPVLIEEIICDTREQRPLWPEATKATLDAGDYSLAGYESVISVERKTVADLYGSLGAGRRRFLRCVRRLSLLPVRAVVIEGSMSDIMAYPNPGRLTAATVMGTVTSWSVAYGLPVWFAGDADGARAVILSLLRFGRERLGPGYRHGDIPCACGGGRPVPHASRCSLRS